MAQGMSAHFLALRHKRKQLPFKDILWRLRNAGSNFHFELLGLSSALVERLFPPAPDRLIVIDDVFPQLTTGFRVAEFNAILNQFDNATVYTTNRRRSVYSRYSAAYPGLGRRVRRFHSLLPLRGSAAYLVFVNNAFSHVEALETANVPIVFELYPGGGFQLHDPESDRRLRRVFGSRSFYKVVVTQSITCEYLLQKKFCREDQILFIYGAVVPAPMLEDGVHKRVRYGLGKDHVDICFAAFKYMPLGSDKGYDRFIATAQILSNRFPNVRFHVVGNFDENDCDLGDLRRVTRFYGPRPPSFLAQFYSRMDLIVSPNVPFVLAPGAFDGFPTASCMEAALCGTAMFVTDELKLNESRLKDGQDCVIIPPQPEKIAALIGEYIGAPSRLARLGENGQRKMRQLLATDVQMAPRLRLLLSAMRCREANMRSARTLSPSDEHELRTQKYR